MRAQMNKTLCLLVTCVALMGTGSAMARPLHHSLARVPTSEQIYTGAFMEWVLSWIDTHLT